MKQEFDNVKKIVIIDLAFIGDIILLTPVTRALKQRFPHASITMMTVPLTATVAAMNPYVDDVLIYDKKGEHRGLSGMWKAAKMLKPHKFDLAVCMNFATRGSVVAWLARIPYRLGYDAQHASIFLTWAQSHIREGIKHETKNQLEILRPLGITTDDTSLKLSPNEEVYASLAKKKQELGITEEKYYVMCPFGSYERKNMPMPLAAKLLREMQKKYPVYLIGGKKEEIGLKGMAQAGKVPEKCILAGTLNLQELTAFIAGAEAMVTVDTGPAHIAQAVNCPTVTLFGPTDPVIWGPQNKNSCTIYHKRDCSPCWGKGECKGNICMESIKAEEILRALP